jgi:hypothetical protein
MTKKNERYIMVRNFEHGIDLRADMARREHLDEKMKAMYEQEGHS